MTSMWGWILSLPKNLNYASVQQPPRPDPQYTFHCVVSTLPAGHLPIITPSCFATVTASGNKSQVPVLERLTQAQLSHASILVIHLHPPAVDWNIFFSQCIFQP